MRLAVDLGKQSIGEQRDNPPPQVGAVVVKDGLKLGGSFRGQIKAGDHAEYCLLEKLLPAEDLSGATVYTTLEPCSRRNHPKVPCAQRLVERGVAEVVIGIYDPNPKIYREGWRILRDGGVRLRDFPPELRAEIRADNHLFLEQFRISRGQSGTACFDYSLNGHQYVLGTGDSQITTTWSRCGKRSIYAVDNKCNVAHARYAKEFSEIDDPSSLDFSTHSIRLAEGEIGVFRSSTGYFAVIRIERVFSGADYGDDRYEVSFKYEIRSPKTQ